MNALGGVLRRASQRRCSLDVRGLLAAFVALAAAVLAAGALPDLAVAAAPDGTCALCVLNPSGTALKLSGTGSTTLTKGNVLVNSTGSPAVALTGTGSLTAPSVGVAGTASVTGTGKIANLTTGSTPAADPLATLAVPSVTVPASIPSVALTGTTSKTISPGVYKDITSTGTGKLTLSAGTYIVTHAFSVTALEGWTPRTCRSIWPVRRIRRRAAPGRPVRR